MLKAEGKREEGEKKSDLGEKLGGNWADWGGFEEGANARKEELMRKRNTRCPVKFPANEHQCESVLYAENTLVHFTGDYVYAIKKNLLETRA